MKLLQRIHYIVSEPKDTRPVVEQESGRTASIYRYFLIYVMAIPAAPDIWWLATNSLSLLMVLALASVVEALAPIFGGRKVDSTRSSA